MNAKACFCILTRITNVHCLSSILMGTRYQTMQILRWWWWYTLQVFMLVLCMQISRYMTMEDNIFFARSCLGFYLFDYYALQTSFSYINHIILFTIIIFPLPCMLLWIFIVLFCISLHRVFHMEHPIFKYL